MRRSHTKQSQAEQLLNSLAVSSTVCRFASKLQQDMTEPTHPASSGHLPAFVAAPGETDVLMVVIAVVLVVFVLMIGLVYFRMHALPDRFAHNKVQLEIVCVLGPCQGSQ